LDCSKSALTKKRPKEPECTTDIQCKPLNGISRSCQGGECVLKYDRILSLVMVSNVDHASSGCETKASSVVDSGTVKNHLEAIMMIKYMKIKGLDVSTKSGDYELQEKEYKALPIFTSTGKEDTSYNPQSEAGQLRGYTSTFKTRLCALYDTKEASGIKSGDMSDGSKEAWGVCSVSLVYGHEAMKACNGPHESPVKPAGFSLSDFNTYDGADPLILCVKYCGCEGRKCKGESRSKEGPRNPTKALGFLMPVRSSYGTCPKKSKSTALMHAEGNLQRVGQSGGTNGDINQQMNTGGSVWLCSGTSRARVKSRGYTIQR